MRTVNINTDNMPRMKSKSSMIQNGNDFLHEKLNVKHIHLTFTRENKVRPKGELSWRFCIFNIFWQKAWLLLCKYSFLAKVKKTFTPDLSL